MLPIQAVVIVLGAAGFITAAPQKPNPAKFGWHTDYASARAEAARTGKPIFLVFRCEP
jgi:hypothetical protein